MTPIIKARIVCYGPDDYGIMYEYEGGGIGGCQASNLKDAVREVARINKLVVVAGDDEKPV